MLARLLSARSSPGLGSHAPEGGEEQVGLGLEEGGKLEGWRRGQRVGSPPRASQSWPGAEFAVRSCRSTLCLVNPLPASYTQLARPPDTSARLPLAPSFAQRCAPADRRETYGPALNLCELSLSSLARSYKSYA